MLAIHRDVQDKVFTEYETLIISLDESTDYAFISKLASHIHGAQRNNACYYACTICSSESYSWYHIAQVIVFILCIVYNAME